MDLRLQSVTSPVSGRGDLASQLTKPLQKAEARGNGFSAELESALRAVSASQNHSSHMQKQVQLENPNVEIGRAHV